MILDSNRAARGYFGNESSDDESGDCEDDNWLLDESPGWQSDYDIDGLPSKNWAMFRGDLFTSIEKRDE